MDATIGETKNVFQKSAYYCWEEILKNMSFFKGQKSTQIRILAIKFCFYSF